MHEYFKFLQLGSKFMQLGSKLIQWGSKYMQLGSKILQGLLNILNIYLNKKKYLILPNEFKGDYMIWRWGHWGQWGQWGQWKTLKNKNMEQVHVGEIILRKMKEKYYTRTKFAGMIGITIQSLNFMLKKRSIQSERLLQICGALECNIFDEMLQKSGVAKVIRKDVGMGELNGQSKLVKKTKLETENDVLKQENAFLRALWWRSMLGVRC